MRQISYTGVIAGAWKTGYISHKNNEYTYMFL